PGADFFDAALTKLTELERPERDTDQQRDAKPEMAEHITDLAILAFSNAEREPHIGALHAVKRGFDRAIVDVIDDRAAPQTVEPILRNRAVRTHAIAPQPSRRGQFQDSRQRAIIGEKQEAFGVEIESPDADQARQIARQVLKDRRSNLRIGGHCHYTAGVIM